MSTTLQFIIVLLSSSVIAALVSVSMQKRNEKETRLFNAKLEAYKEFVAHLESRFVSITKGGRSLDISTLAEISAKCLLVYSSVLNRELKAFLVYVSEVYKRCSAPDYNKNKETDMFNKLWSDAENIESLMREDLGFK